jgi:hypothetical protein
MEYLVTWIKTSVAISNLLHISDTEWNQIWNRGQCWEKTVSATHFSTVPPFLTQNTNRIINNTSGPTHEASASNAWTRNYFMLCFRISDNTISCFWRPFVGHRNFPLPVLTTWTELQLSPSRHIPLGTTKCLKLTEVRSPALGVSTWPVISYAL